MHDSKSYWAFISAFAVTKCVLISAFASLLGILIGISSSTIGLEICATTTGIKKCVNQFLRKRKRSMIK